MDNELELSEFGQAVVERWERLREAVESSSVQVELNEENATEALKIILEDMQLIHNLSGEIRDLLIRAITQREGGEDDGEPV